jgi:ABC-type thiamine transport system ATPase subunit
LTLADNVKYGCSSAPAETDLAEVAKASNMDFIGSGTNNTLQWNSPLGPRGGLLSGGQKQRAAIARAQLRKRRTHLLLQPSLAVPTLEFVKFVTSPLPAASSSGRPLLGPAAPASVLITAPLSR